VVARGTARAISSLSPYVAGKTGTTEDAVDGWFVGFTNDVTIAVWVGYDNGDRKRRSLGSSETGAHVALPIFEPIIEAIWVQQIAPKTVLSGPSAAAESNLKDMPIDYESGDRARTGHGFTEHFRRQPDGKVDDTQYQLVSHQSSSNSDVRSVRADHPRMVSHKSSPNSDVRSVKAEHPRMAWRKSSPTSPAQGANTSNQGYYRGGNQGYGGLYLNWGGWGGASWH